MLQELCCEYCGGIIKNNPHSKSGHYRVCKKYRNFKKDIHDKITYDFLHQEYVVNERSATAIAKGLGLKKATIVQEKLKEFNIKIRTLSESRFTKGYIESSKKTSLEKYGAEYHTSNDSNIRNEITKGTKNKYNVDNVFQLDSVKGKCKKTKLKRHGDEYYNNRIKFKATCLDKFGYNNPWKSPEIREKCIKTILDNPKAYSYSSKKANDFFNILFEQLRNKDHIYFAAHNKEFGLRSKKDKRYYFYDFVDTTNKKCIEFNGNYWHANPLMYESNFLNKKSGLTAKDVWKRDDYKLKVLEDAGYEILIVWELEYDTSKDEIIKACVNFLNS